MSAGSEVSVLGFRRWSVSKPSRAQAAEHPIVRLATFAALALWGCSRWATLIKPAPAARIYGICAIAIVVAGAGAWLARRSRLLAAALALIAALGMLAAAGIPLEWIRHVRITVTGDALGQGLTALPNVLVPYLGINQWVRVVIVLGAAVLLLDAALLAALTPRPGRDLRRAAAAMPLVALAIVPATIIRPGLPYLQGLVLFALLAAFMWADRLAARDVSGTIGVLTVVAVGAIIVGPRIDPGSAWVNYQSLAGSLSLKNVDRFNWTQSYGQLVWPRDNRVVFNVKASHGDYWKAENLDVFDGKRWAAQATDVSGGIPQPPPAARGRWTQSLQVTIEAMKTTYVIAAGTASTPEHVPEGVAPGISSGTWIAGALLGPGASYTVSTYSPRPTVDELASSPPDVNADLLAADMTIDLPRTPTTIGNPPEVTFQPFHAPRAAITLTPPGVSPTTLIDASPYGRAFALARRLAARSPTPYTFIESVMRYLSHGFSYDENPPPSRYPLESFLFNSKHGYCQQFAGAMALLLRMGGIPARVAVGFTPGTYDKATGEWQVDDFDAHAWVEAWFPQYGWVRFDPTPAAAPARGGATELILKKTTNGPGGADSNKTHDITGKFGSPGTALHPGGHSSDTLLIVLVLLLVLVAAPLVLVLVWRRRERNADQLIAELERAMRRTGRPMSDGVTLAALERRLRNSSAAEAYVRALRLQRFAGGGPSPAPSDRRAVRRQLVSGLGPLARLRGLWALPPRPAPRTRKRPGGDVQSS